MNNHTTRNYGIAAAAVIAAGAIALNAFAGSKTGTVTSPTPNPSASSTAAPTRLTVADLDTTLRAGGYRVVYPFAAGFQAEMPDGWSLRNLNEGSAEFGVAGTNGSPYLGFFVVSGVYVDACDPQSGTRRTHHRGGLGSDPAIYDAESLTAYLRNIRGVSAGPVTHVAVGGRAASHFFLTNSIDMAVDRCPDDPWVYLFDPYHGEPARTVAGTTQEVWVVSETSSDWPVLIVGEVSESAAPDQATISDIVNSVSWASGP